MAKEWHIKVWNSTILLKCNRQKTYTIIIGF